MKKILPLLLALLAAGCAGGARKDKPADALRSDPYKLLAERLSEAHGRMVNRKVAVLPFSYTDRRESDDGVVVSERLLTRIIQEGKLEVVERHLLEKVMGELKLQYSGAVDDSSIKSLGKILGVEAVVTGTLTRQSGGLLEINARLIKTETAAVLAACAAQARLDWESLAAVPELSAPEPAAPPARPRRLPAPGFPEDWKYRENLRVAERSGSSLVEYQVLVKFDSASAIRLGRMKTDCSDVRFSNSDERTGLAYWLEGGCGTPETRAWVRLPFLAKNSVKNIYLYYGNAAAAGESSGDIVFLVFDDFNDGSINGAKWSVITGECPVAETGGRLRFLGCSNGSTMQKAYLKTAQPLPEKYVAEFDGSADESGSNCQYHYLPLRWDGAVLPAGHNMGPGLKLGFGDGCSSDKEAVLYEQRDEGHTEIAKARHDLTPGAGYFYSIADSGSGLKISVDGKQLLAAATSFRGGYLLGLSARDYPHNKAVYYDNFRVRTYAPAEPEVYLYRPGEGGLAGGKYRSVR